MWGEWRARLYARSLIISLLLPALQHNLNNSLSEVLGKSPNKVVLGFKPRTLVDIAGYKPDDIRYTAAIETIRQTHQDEAVVLIDAAGEIAKLRYNDKHSPTSYEVGDIVYLRLGKGYHLPGKPARKLSPTRAGPFKVLAKIGNAAYKLDFPDY